MTPMHRATLIVHRLAILPSDQKRTVEMIADAIAAAVLAEREACAEAAWNHELRAHNPSDLNFRSGMEWMRQKIAQAIRARTAQEEGE